MRGDAVLTALLAGEARELATAEETHALGVALGRVLRAGDLVLLTGDLAAGKTTLTRGIGEGLAVRGPITSPTFVIARVHPSLVSGPDLVHVDAYRLGGLAELDDLDLDADLGAVVTVVEWGHGLAETLADDRLEVLLSRKDVGDPEDLEGPQPRVVRVSGHGARWAGVTSAG
ncbi:tRNA (adenosine(37)-N6)-threonylcarbamoyltransferase complex ATPase subunit type 1 TsaE [Ornithinimicrobium cavernae]|uniref:tRNA (adenosine(37)-N6)-threonylcarbamoyltransferase complex ATPase subunit type 1 TsaE n=1 Tax=Ornithinimicrobium cavernae TaxID=2666047 RepID=UPI000D6942B9|nr:tRNA (adenosine(37)-N6)-threonylcarbamoyltransferase complex ATPase subunit type 1 TsaE [Ornithinimicrobium cavernae]